VPTKIFWTKIALFFGKYCNNQVKIPTIYVHISISCLKWNNFYF
jgi:hypothetical protein